MELMQQLEAWQQQIDANPTAVWADMDVAKRLVRHGIEVLGKAQGLRAALATAEAALADIGDADREPGDDITWAEQRAARALPQVRAALMCVPLPMRSNT